MDEIAKYFFNIDVVRMSWPLLWSGFLVTVRLALLTVIFGILFGFLVALVRAYRVPVVDQLLVLYIDFFRAVPSLVVLVVLYFGLPYVGVTFSGETATVVGLALVLGAYAAEIFWTGMLVIDRGQWEAAFATGLSFTRTLWHIVLPRAVRIGIPVLTNRTIAITKGTAYGSIISAEEILSVSASAQSTYANPTPLVAGACLYLLIFLPLVVVSRRIEARYTLRV